MKYTNIKWNLCEQIVLKLQRKIIVAWKLGDKQKVFNLQETLVKTFAARALAIRRVTNNKGGKTSVIDGITLETNETKMAMIHELKQLSGYKALPVRRVMIPKSNGKLRPLGIPTIKDRCVQALYIMALDPIAETTADAKSYGFRKYRSTQDVQTYLRTTLSLNNRAKYIMDIDIKSFFDTISHEWILENIPINKKILKEWLKCGFYHNSQEYDSVEGVPQGGIISPTIANMVLDGLQEVINKKSDEIKKCEQKILYKKTGFRNYNTKINYVRYADDFIITAGKKQYLHELIVVINDFLKKRGVEINQDKTRIYHINKGFDFLGFNFRKYNTTTKKM